MTWTILRGVATCGATGHVIPAGKPVAILAGKMRRCEEHAGEPVDWKAIDAAMLAFEREELEAMGRRQAVAVTRQQVRPRIQRPLTALAEVIKHADLPAEVRRRDQAIAGRDE